MFLLEIGWGLKIPGAMPFFLRANSGHSGPGAGKCRCVALQRPKPGDLFNGQPGLIQGTMHRMGPPLDSVNRCLISVAEFYVFMIDITIVNGDCNGL